MSSGSGVGRRLWPRGLMGLAVEGGMMKFQSNSLVVDKDEKYAHFWFASFCTFHNIPDNESQKWNFDEKYVQEQCVHTETPPSIEFDSSFAVSDFTRKTKPTGIRVLFE